MGKKKKDLVLIREGTPQQGYCDIKDDITDYECQLIWYLRHMDEECAYELAHQIRRTYCENLFKLEFHNVKIEEPYDYSKVDFTKKYTAFDQQD